MLTEPGGAGVPSWLHLAADGTLTLEPPPNAGAVALEVEVVDSTGAHSVVSYVRPGGVAPGQPRRPTAGPLMQASLHKPAQIGHCRVLPAIFLSKATQSCDSHGWEGSHGWTSTLPPAGRRGLEMETMADFKGR